MFLTKSKVNAIQEESTQKAHLAFTEMICSWHEEHRLNQLELENNFEFNTLNKLQVNFWDDYDEEIGRTYAYVDLNSVPDKVCFQILLHLHNFLMPDYGNNISIRYFDSTSQHPQCLLKQLGRRTSFKRWEILIENSDYSALKKLINRAKAVPNFNGKSFEIYSES